MNIIGIDYGNYNNYISKINNNNFEIILNLSSNRYFKNTIAFKDKIYFDTEAENFYTSNCKNNILFHKLLLNYYNEDFFQYIEKNLFNYKIDNENIYLENGKIRLEQIIALNINYLLKNIEGDKNIYISVPDNYDFYQRKRLIDSFQINEINDVKLVNNSTAISTNYGFYNYINNNINCKKNILFIDFGDIHISYFVVSFINNSYEILYKEDLNEVGGLLINLKIMEYIKEKFCKQNNIDNINFKSQMKILKECDKIKKNLNLEQNYYFKSEFFFQDIDIDIEILYEEYKDIISETSQKIQNFSEQFKNKIDVEIENIEILGSSSRLNFFREIIKNVYKKDIKTTLNTEETIANGLNVYSAIKIPQIITKEYKFNLVNTDNINLQINGKKISIFQKGDILPINKYIEVNINKKDKIFICNENKYIEIVLENLSESNKLKINVNMDENQLINIVNVYKITEDQKENGIDFLFNVNLKNEEISEMINENKKLIDHNNKIDLLFNLKNNLENLYYQYLDNIESKEYTEIYTEKEIENFRSKLDEIYIDIEEIENPEDTDKIKNHIYFIKQNEKIKKERENKIKTIDYKNKKLNDMINKNIENNLMSSIIEEYKKFVENNDIYNIQNINENIKFMDEKIKNIIDIQKTIIL